MFREAGMQVSAVTMSHSSPRTPAPRCLPFGIKDSLKEDARVFAFGFLMERAFGCGRFLEGKIAGGRLLKWENAWLKGDC
jgi:hypothetical protein